MATLGIREIVTSLDDVFDVLSTERRRYALYYLQKEDRKVPVDELIETVVSWEENGSTEAPREEEFRRAEISFKQVHLPKTADIEFIEYNSDEETIQIEGISPEYESIVTIAKLIEQPE